ncbi:unnamed protein product [Echinostoma caproni]|uniref:Amidase domain-containing protein n=1 Tax=Echinostoma caproni TaxID=27848 RepID=A0A183A9X4_9TREM|nr:unnamed protein product [Echinostoma caproni]
MLTILAVCTVPDGDHEWFESVYTHACQQWTTFIGFFPAFSQWISNRFSHKTIISVGFTLICLHFGWNSIKRYRLHRRLHQKRARIAQRALRIQANLPSTVGRRTGPTPLTECTLDKIQALLRSGEITPVDLLHAFQSKVLQLWNSGNSGVCELVLEANEEARKLDGTLLQNAKTAPLYGVPVSLKELCSVRGYDATFGLLKRCGQPLLDDCVLVKTLRHEGAIPFVLTATSQLALATCGFNPVVGRLTNPHSTNHEPGGSSSGEGVLLSRYGSIVGLGTDIGGSIRIPAHFCGLTGLKTTSQRLSTQGIARLNEQSVFMLQVSVGPMARQVTDLVAMMRTLLRPSMFSLDPTVPPIPFNEAIFSGLDKPRLTIGYFETFKDRNLMETVPSVRRAVRQAVAVLSRQGHRVVKFDPPEPFWAMQLSLRAICTDGGESTADALTMEPLSKHTRSMKIASRIPKSCFPLLDWLTRRMVGPPMALARYVRGFQKPDDAFYLASDIVTYRGRFAEAWAGAGPLDALVCPVSIYPAPSLEMPAYFEIPSIVYTILFNLVDYPAGSVPVDRVIKEDIEQANRLMTEARENGDRHYEMLYYHQSDTLGLPLGVQVVGKPFEEELVLRVMRELEQSKME